MLRVFCVSADLDYPLAVNNMNTFHCTATLVVCLTALVSSALVADRQTLNGDHNGNDNHDGAASNSSHSIVYSACKLASSRA